MSPDIIGYVALGIFSTFIILIMSICVCGSCFPKCHINCNNNDTNYQSL